MATIAGTSTERVGTVLTGFVGRERELAALTSALSEGLTVVLVEGEAGVGKSRLLREFLAVAGTRRRLVASCPPYREPHTLGPVVDAVRQATDRVDGLGLSDLAGALRPLFPEWSAQLPPAPAPVSDAKDARHRLFRALTEMLVRLDITVLVVEDAHWAHDATLEFLLYLAFRQPPAVSLVVTYRPEEVPDDSLLRRLSLRSNGHRHRLTLPALTEAQTAELVSSMLDNGPVSAEFARFMHHHTGGLPLAVEELVRLMWDRADLIRQDGEWARRLLAEIEVPPTVRDIVAERVARLGPPAQAVLGAVAVLGDAHDETTVAAVAGLSEPHRGQGVHQALTSGLLRAEDGLLVMRHALAGLAVYEMTPPGQRREMHLRAGRALSELVPRHVARVANHFQVAGEIALWRRYAEIAADVALTSSDEPSAAVLLSDVLTGATLPAAEVLRLVGKLPFAALAGRQRHRALVGRLREVLAQPGTPPATGAALRVRLSQLLLVMEEYVEGRQEAELAIATGELDPSRAAHAMRALASLRGEAWPKAVHLRWLERSHEMELLRDHSPAEQLTYDGARHAMLLMLGEESGWVGAERVPDRTTDPALGRALVCANLNIGNSALIWGRYADAARRLTAAGVGADECQYLGLRGAVLVTQAHLDWFTGAWDGLAERAGEIAENVDLNPETRSEANLVAGWVGRALGDFATAEREFRFRLDDALHRHAVALAQEPAGALADLYLEQRRVGDALRVTDELARLLVFKDMWVWATEIAPSRVRALLAADRTRDAVDLVARFADGLADTAAPAAQAALALCRALLVERDHPAAAAAAYAEVASAWDALPRPYDALLARERRARVLVDAEPEAARSLLTEVFRGLSDLGARADAHRVARALRRLGVDVRGDWRRGRRGYGDELSPREREVVRLVTSGMTNREAAEVLSRSPKTVARQLGSAMRKLGVSTRTALAVHAVETGLVDGGEPPDGPESVI